MKKKIFLTIIRLIIDFIILVCLFLESLILKFDIIGALLILFWIIFVVPSDVDDLEFIIKKIKKGE